MNTTPESPEQIQAKGQRDVLVIQYGIAKRNPGGVLPPDAVTRIEQQIRGLERANNLTQFNLADQDAIDALEKVMERALVFRRLKAQQNPGTQVPEEAIIEAAKLLVLNLNSGQQNIQMEQALVVAVKQQLASSNYPAPQQPNVNSYTRGASVSQMPQPKLSLSSPESNKDEATLLKEAVIQLTKDAQSHDYRFPVEIEVILAANKLMVKLPGSDDILARLNHAVLIQEFFDLGNNVFSSSEIDQITKLLNLQEYDDLGIVDRLEKQYHLGLGTLVNLLHDFRSLNALNNSSTSVDIVRVLSGYNPPIETVELEALLNGNYANDLRAVLAIILNADKADFTDALKQLASTRPGFQLNSSLNINSVPNSTYRNETGFKELKTLLESLNGQVEQGRINYETALENLFKYKLIGDGFRTVIIRESRYVNNLTLVQAGEWLSALGTVDTLIHKLIEKDDSKDIWDLIYRKIINITSPDQINGMLGEFLKQIITGNVNEKTTNPPSSADVATIRDAFYSAKVNPIFLDVLTIQTGLSEEEIRYMTEFDKSVEASKPDSPNNDQWIKSAYENALELIDGSNISLLNKIKIIIAIVTNYVPKIDFPDMHAFLAAAIIRHNMINTYEYPTDSEFEQLAKDLNINLESLRKYISPS